MGLWVRGAQVVLSTLSQLMATKMEEPILHIEGLVNVRIKIAVARSYSRMLSGYQVPSPLWTKEPDLGSGLGFALAQKTSRAKIVSRTPTQPLPFEYTPTTSFECATPPTPHDRRTGRR